MSTRPSRFRRSMTPSSSVKMTPSRFNLVCGKTRETAVTPNTPRSVPRSAYPSHNAVEYTSGSITPSYHAHLRDRSHSVTRDVRSSQTRDAPIPPTRDSSLYLPFGSYADLGIHTKPPSKYAAGVASAYGSAYGRHIRQGSVTPISSADTRDARRRSITPGPSFPSAGLTHQVHNSYQRQTSYQSERRSSSTFTSQSFRRPSFSMSLGTPSGARGVCSFYHSVAPVPCFVVPGSCALHAQYAH